MSERKYDTSQFVPGLKEVIDQKKPSDQQPTEIVGSMQEQSEKNVHVDDEKIADEQTAQEEALAIRHAKQKIALENAQRQGRIEEGRARSKIIEAARDGRFADTVYQKTLQEKAGKFVNGQAAEMSQDEKDDLQMLYAIYHKAENGGASNFNKTLDLAYKVFGKKEPVQPVEEKKPGLLRRLFGSKKP